MQIGSLSKSRLHHRNGVWAGLAILVVMTSACSSPGAPRSQHANESTTRLRPGAVAISPAVVVAELPGYVSEESDTLAHSATGDITFSEAVSAQCGGVGAQLDHDRWLASHLSYFTETAQPSSTVTLCVTKFSSSQFAHDQESQFERIGLGHLGVRSPIVPAQRFVVPSVPDSTGESIGPGASTVYISLAKDAYFAFVIASSTPTTANTEDLATSLAASEYRLLH
jgi:hypothetical protein